MKTFTEYLTEARMAPLYHGTSGANAHKILASNMLRAGTSGMFEDVAISLSRNIDFARDFAKTNHDKDEIVVFELDQQKLAQRYKINPYNFWDTRTRRSGPNKRNEYEERLNRSITDLDKYITKIIIFEKPGRPVPGNLILNHPKLYYNGKFVN